MTCTERSTGNPKFYYFGHDWNLPRNYNIPGQMAPADFTLPKSSELENMFNIAKELSIGFPHVRVDLYSCKGKIYFGELRLFSQSGFDADHTDELELH